MDVNKFPYELLSIINSYAADWVGFESLLEVSPQLKELFSDDSDTKADIEAVGLVESILQQNPVMRYELHSLFRMVLKLRQPSMANVSLAEFMAQDHSSSLMVSFPSVSRVMLKELVGIAANIQRLACACLTTFLHRVRMVQPRCWVEDKEEGTEPYQPREAGPSSWIEEYRVYRALWHLQLYSDLSIAGRRLNWPQCDLEDWWFEQMKWDQVPVVLGEEVLAISECLEALDGVCPTLHTTKGMATRFYNEKHLFEIHLISQLPNARQLRHEFDTWAPPSPPKIADAEETSRMDVWGQGVTSIHRNRMATIFRVCQLRTSTHPARHQVCQIQDSRPWRGLGMPIWDLWRCYCLGLYAAKYPRGRHRGPIPAPDGSSVPEGCSPADCGFEIDYRISVFLHARMQMEDKKRKGMVSK
ncbi:hypothetical protein BO85DRAFT_522529 [Aspergillus piperis CBS 112811]|uniref:Uncharacterized protein n=1 Tax=Aspergillus piperis CBS 112811 TaxID=1448313 RepID=A0A8G1QXV0_9EURO|nr:hypothetical protein BO85DRAFT_522529 [Aspergillus piperis CBS 112811]RAH54599.1 hypothetical protein BO85DRAFT_522529 [Aspergillus piperis CBS 112811]